MTYYSYEWTDGKAFLADIEPDVSIEVIEDCGEPYLSVTSLRIDGVDLLASPTPSVKALAREIKTRIEADDDWCAERLEEEGWHFRSRGGTDPEAEWISVGV